MTQESQETLRWGSPHNAWHCPSYVVEECLAENVQKLEPDVKD